MKKDFIFQVLKINTFVIKIFAFFACLISVIVLSGCVSEENPGISTPGYVDKIGEKATAQNSYNAIKPTPNQNIDNMQDSTAKPYDPVINFTDPYFENVVRDILGKSIGDVLMSDVSGIKTIKARVRGIRNINDIVYFTSLEELDLYGNKINDISPLSQLPNLRILNIGKNYNTLYSGNTGGSAGLNLNVLSSLPLLEELYAEDNNISDLSFVEGLSQLRILNLSNNSLSDVSSLAKLYNLETLMMSSNKITDMSAISTCEKITYIDVSNNYYEVLDDQTMFYTGFGIKDLDFAKKLINLTYLNVSMNMVNSLDGITKLKSLRSVYADDNYITDISCLKNNDSIQLLSVKRNFIKDFSVVAGMKNLTELFFVGNPVTDTEVLKKFESKN